MKIKRSVSLHFAGADLDSVRITDYVRASVPGGLLIFRSSGRRKPGSAPAGFHRLDCCGGTAIVAHSGILGREVYNHSIPGLGSC